MPTCPFADMEIVPDSARNTVWLFAAPMLSVPPAAAEFDRTITIFAFADVVRFAMPSMNVASATVAGSPSA